MTATNHTLTGALIAANFPKPLIAIPLALASHLVLDALPHFGGDQLSHTDTKYFIILASDAAMAAFVLSLIIVVGPAHWLLMITCAIIAASPDLLWLPYWIAELRGQKHQLGKLSRFLSWIQWGERPWGWIFELIWFLPASFLLGKILSR